MEGVDCFEVPRVTTRYYLCQSLDYSGSGERTGSLVPDLSFAARLRAYASLVNMLNIFRS